MFGPIFPEPHFNEGNPDALTPRAVTAAAGVQAPTIYRLFGDNGGLLDAVGEHGFATYLKEAVVQIGRSGIAVIHKMKAWHTEP